MNNDRELSELLDRISKSDSVALCEFEKNYSRIIFVIAYSICKNKEDAEDISQNVLLKLFQLPEDKFPSTGHKTWLYIKHREIASLLNKPTGTIRWLYSKALYSVKITLGSVFVFWISLATTLFRSGKSRSSDGIQLFNNFDFWLGLIMVLSLCLALLFGMSAFLSRCNSNKT